jgi:predicted nucleotidyltransferase
VRVFYPQLSSEEILSRLVAGVRAVQRSLPLVRVILFGSYAAGSYTVGSDVGLLVVHGGKPRPDAYRLLKLVMGTPRLEPHVYTEQEAEASRDRLAAMLQHSVPIYP